MGDAASILAPAQSMLLRRTSSYILAHVEGLWFEPSAHFVLHFFLLKKCRSPVHVLVHPPTSSSSPLLRRHKFPPPFGLYHPLVVRWHSAEQLLLTDLVWGVVTVSIGRYWTTMNLTTKRRDSSVDLWISCRWFWCSRPRPHMAIFEHVVLSHWLKRTAGLGSIFPVSKPAWDSSLSSDHCLK